MALRSDWSTRSCPIERGLDVLGDPWTLLVLREVMTGHRRYDELRTRLGASDSVLADRLRRAVDDGLLEKVAYSAGESPRHEYRVTPAGADALPVLHALVDWGNRHRPHELGPLRVIHRDCGTETSSVDRCDACAVPLTAENSRWDEPTRRDRLVDLEGVRG